VKASVMMSTVSNVSFSYVYMVGLDHYDVCGSMQLQMQGGNPSILLFIDDISR